MPWCIVYGLFQANLVLQILVENKDYILRKQDIRRKKELLHQTMPQSNFLNLFNFVRNFIET